MDLLIEAGGLIIDLEASSFLSVSGDCGPEFLVVGLFILRPRDVRLLRVRLVLRSAECRTLLVCFCVLLLSDLSA